jgi:hypothetical protein
MYIYAPYFYILQDTSNGMYYAGARWIKDCDPEELLKLDGYNTSSNTIKNIIKKNGIDSFKIRKIKIFEDGRAAVDYETRFLKKVNARKNIDFYNMHNNDFIFDSDKNKFITELLYGDGITNISQTEYWKSIIKNKQPEINDKRLKTISENWDNEFRKAMKQKKQESWKTSPKLQSHSKNTSLRRIEEEKNITESQREERSQKGKDSWDGLTDKEKRERALSSSESVKQSYINNPELRKLRSECFKGIITITKDGKNKRVQPEKVDEYLTDGWTVGSNCKGIITITKDGKNKRVQPEKVDEYLTDGWRLGKTKPLRM